MAKEKSVLVHRFSGEANIRRPSGPLWQPAADIYRTPEGWKVKLDLAGVRTDDVEVFVSEDAIVVRGVRRDSVMSEGWSYHQLEITYSRFERILKIPCDLSNAEVRSECKDGWLILHIVC